MERRVLSSAWPILATTLLLVAMAVALWRWAMRRQRRQVMASHIAARIAADVLAHGTVSTSPAWRGVSALNLPRDPWAPGSLGTAGGTAGLPAGGLSAEGRQARGVAGKAGAAIDRWLPDWLRCVVAPRQLGLAAGGAVASVSMTAGIVGLPAAGGLLVVLVASGVFVVWLRLQRFRRRLTVQLPGFIDVMVRLIRIGNSPQAAFQQSIAALKAPLRSPMETAGALLRAGVELDQALLQAALPTRVDALRLLAAILGLGVRYGGRSDVLLERAAGYMRDSEQAEQELVAMSAETRLSAWILGLLPLGVGAAILMTNGDYFVRMWLDGTGRIMIFSAFGLQALGVLLLYRLARLR
jgi:tight adherence protein B